MGKGNYLDKVLAQGSAVWGALRLVQDNWQNVFTGLGTSRDKTTYGAFVRLGEVRDSELAALYHQNDTAKRVVALKPQEMLRKGFTVNIENDTDTSSAIMRSLRDMKAPTKLRDAMIWGRLYGGGAILIGADDGRPADEPLEEARVRSVRFLHVLDRRYLIPDRYFNDPLNDEDFGQPEVYMIVPRHGGSNLRVHRSRLIIFGGAHTDEEERDRLGGWDHSVLTAIYPVLRQFDAVWQAAEHLMSDASQAVFKIQGLMSMIAGGQKDVLQTRMQLVDMSRSVARALLLDADAGEEFSRESSSFTDAQAMLDKFMLRLASAAEVPVTILMGQSPAGMNATGESDFRWFYDSIATAQENELLPQLERLVRVVMLAKDGPTRGNVPEGWAIKFAPLWQPTPVEQAELEKKHAEKDALYVNAGVILPEEVALSRFRPEGWSAETQIDRELRETMLDAEKHFEIEPEHVEPIVEEVDKPTATGADLGFSPTDTATFTMVNEARQSKGLPAWPDPEEGKLTVAAFKALKESEATKVGEAEGAAAADKIKPEGEGEGSTPVPPTPPDNPPPAPPVEGDDENPPAPPVSGDESDDEDEVE